MEDHQGRSTVIQSLLDRHARGDESAKEELILYSMERLRRLARKMLRQNQAVRRWNETDDVLQNALVRLHRALQTESPESTSRFIGLAAAQIRRELIDLWRHYYGPHGLGAHHLSDPVNNDSGEARNPRFEAQDVETNEGEIGTEDMERFHRAVSELPPDLLDVFNKSFYWGMTQEEIAKGLEVSTKTVKRRWRDAKLALHKKLATDE